MNTDDQDGSVSQHPVLNSLSVSCWSEDHCLFIYLFIRSLSRRCCSIPQENHIDSTVHPLDLCARACVHVCNCTPDAVKSGHLCLFTAPANQPHPLPALWKTASIFHPYHQMVKWLPCCVSLACCPDTAMPTYSFTPLRLSILASLGSHLAVVCQLESKSPESNPSPR